MIKLTALFISYNSALEPLIQSQGIPYLKGLSAEGMRCIMLTYEKPPLNKESFRLKVRELKKDLAASGIKWYHLKYHKRPTLPATLFDITIGIIFAFYIVIANRVNLIHARATVPAAMGYVLKKITGRKLLFDLRGLMAEEYVDGGNWKENGFLYQLTSFLEKNFMLNSDALIVLTHNIKEYLLTTGYLPKKPLQISVIPCCADTNKFTGEALTLKSRKLEKRLGVENKFIFLYSGSFGTWYLLGQMCDFFLEAKKTIPRAHFLILTNSEQEPVKNLYKTKGLSEDDFTITSVEYETIPQHLKLADVGIFFIKPCFSKRSSCPIKFAEFLASGLPLVINAGIGDTDQIIRERNLGVVINEFSQDSYQEGIRQLNALMGQADALSSRCRKAAEEIFSLESGVNKYYTVYKQLSTA